MLVLTRTPNTSIVIGEGKDQVEVVILGVSGNQTKVGISAPDHIEVHRREVYERIQQEKKHGNTSR